MAELNSPPGTGLWAQGIRGPLNKSPFCYWKSQMSYLKAGMS